MFSQTDCDRMRKAVGLARQGLYTASSNPRVGCLIVKDGRIIGRGWHKKAGMPHAEVEALRDCSSDTSGATVYVTLEPCSYFGKTPPCTDALLEAGVSRVVVGNSDPNPKVDGLQKLKDAGVEVQSGCESELCATLNPGFVSRMQRGRPWVRVKMAMSLDGRTALANGESQWITSEAARDDVQRWRAQADCLLTGIGTVLQDDPRLTVRLSQDEFAKHGFGEVTQPCVAIADTGLAISPDAELFKAGRKVLIYSTVVGDASLYPQAEVVNVPADEAKGIDLKCMLEDIASREINEVHVEAGATLCAALTKAQLVDELLLYVAPNLLGADAKSLFALSGLSSMRERFEFEYTDIEQIGPDLRLRLRPIYN